MSCIFTIAAVTSFLSYIINVRTCPRLSPFYLSLAKRPMRYHTSTSQIYSGRNRKRSTLSYSRALLVLVSISRTSTTCLDWDSFTLCIFSTRNHTCYPPLISSLCSISSDSASSALSVFSIQLYLSLAVSALNICASSSSARASLLLVSTLSAFTLNIPVCSSPLASFYNISNSDSSYFIILAYSNIVLSNFLIFASIPRSSLAIGSTTKVPPLPRDLECERGLLFNVRISKATEV